jgi:potassium-dependent mechanosensitive channel
VTARRFIRFVLAAVLLLAVFAPARAYDEVKLKDAERSAILLQAQLRGVAGRIDSGALQDDALAAQRTTLEKLRAAAGVGADNASGPLNEIASQVKGLGPPPDPALPEAESIAAQRKELNIQLARATAAQKQFVLVGLEADQVLARLTNVQRGQFLQRVFKADKSILSPTLWANTWDGAGILRSHVKDMFAKGLSDAQGRTNASGLLLLPAGLLAIGLLLYQFLPSLMTRLGFPSYSVGGEVPSGLGKLWHVIWSYLKYLLMLTAILFFANAALDVSGYLTPPINNLLTVLYAALESALLYGGLIYFVASPRDATWRLVAINSSAARLLVVIVVLAYVVYGFGDQVSAFASSINLPVSFAVGQSAFSALVLIVLIGIGLMVVRREAGKELAGQGTPYFLTWFMNFMPLWWSLLTVAFLALLLGFIALSYFIAGNLLDTAILVVALGIIHAFVDALSAAANDPHSRTGHTIRSVTRWSEQGILRLVLVLRSFVDAILVIFGLLSLIALWTVVLFDVSSFLTSLSQGIPIGNITLSPKALAIAFAVLSLGLTVTKYVTQWLDRRVLADTQLDKGVQNSLRAMAGYTGYSLAGLFALSAAGLDFSSLAIVFGALGVGIGLGLQSITNNFVSGLILLAERPVRVGDWVVTTAGEGIVKKINVRSTEIETFDSCTIIVPNSNLISGAVKNWTHRDSIGRFSVSVAFVHNVDAEETRKHLLGILQDHTKIMRHPPPTVQLTQIHHQGLEFELHGHVRDVFEAAQVSSDIRVAIIAAFPAASFANTLPAPPAPQQAPTKVRKS